MRCPTWLFLSLALLPPSGLAAQSDWPTYGGDPGNRRWSALDQINRSNVAYLRQAWVYRTGDIARQETHGAESSFEATPIMVDGTLYFSTAFGRVIALDPVTGAARWTFDPKADVHAGYGDFASRGVAFWRDPRAGAGSRAPCARRLFVATIDTRLIAIDAATGRRCASFGGGGEVNLRAGLRNGAVYPAEYEETSPPTVVRGVVVVGSAVADNNRTDAPSGVVRGFDSRTGRLLWAWDPVPQDPADPAYGTWEGPAAHRTGAANAWTVFAADSVRDLVLVPTGSASPDYYGGERRGANRYANSLVALRASTGKVVWHFQAVHHDLWDYDLASPPTLLTLRRGGREYPAVVQATKMGLLFVLDRRTGVPLFPVEERAVPLSDVPGEAAAPTQPIPSLPVPLAPERVTPDDAWGPAPADQEWCRARITALRQEGIYTPPSLEGTLVVPGNVGGAHWGGVAVDETRQLAVIPTNHLPAVIRLVPRAALDSLEHVEPHGEYSPQRGTPYGLHREFLLSPKRLPCVAPPWGRLSAVDLSTGTLRWQRPLGSWPGLATESDADPTGSVNLGGPLLTSGGLVFIAATLEPRFRAFDLETGEERWSVELPAAGKATPMTYLGADGKQYVVVAAGGFARADTPLGDFLVAFRLE
jgi:quinoprotein glucose dehydrogenase